MRLHLFYRATAGDNRKHRPLMYSKRLCLESFVRAAERVRSVSELTFLNDGPMTDDRLAIQRSVGRVVSLPGLGNSGSYRHTLGLALALRDDAIVYFAEDDYLYTQDAFERLLAAFDEIPAADYVTLYDHPDRYVRSDDARGGLSYVFLADGRHWRSVESTCMTFGARVGCLRKDAWIQHLATATATPKDRMLWRMTQGQKAFSWKFPKRTLVGAMPALATHMEAAYLSPNVDWGAVARDVAAWSAARDRVHG